MLDDLPTRGGERPVAWFLSHSRFNPSDSRQATDKQIDGKGVDAASFLEPSMARKQYKPPTPREAIAADDEYKPTEREVAWDRYHQTRPGTPLARLRLEQITKPMKGE